jgi:hypothetical protein
MVVGMLTVRLHLPENSSLKEKRRVVKSLLDRIRDRWNVSCAEIEDQDLWQRATLGVVCLNTDQPHADRTLAQVAAYIESDPRVVVTDINVEFIR